jgi:hypothetical protein
MKCSNCGFEASGNYCSQCGQPTHVARFNGRYLWNSIQDTIDINRGLLHAVWALLARPGKAIREYVDGHRINFYNPFKLFLITGALSTFLIFHFHLYGDTTGESAALEFIGFSEADAFSFYSSKYLTYFSLLAVPIFTLVSWLFFRYTGLNLAENLVMNTYVASGQFLLIILLAPLVLYAPGGVTSVLYAVVNTAYNVWVLAVFFRSTDFEGLLRSTVTVIVSYALMLLVNYMFFVSTPRRWWTLMDEWVG